MNFVHPRPSYFFRIVLISSHLRLSLPTVYCLLVIHQNFTLKYKLANTCHTSRLLACASCATRGTHRLHFLEPHVSFSHLFLNIVHRMLLLSYRSLCPLGTIYHFNAGHIIHIKIYGVRISFPFISVKDKDAGITSTVGSD